MAFTTGDILRKAVAILQDGSSVRWPLPELLGWLNDGTRAIAMVKPTATAVTVDMPLVAGTRQQLPETYHQLLQVVRNNKTTSPVAMRAITPIVKEVMDTQYPGWHSTTVMPFADEVVHMAEDTFDPLTFYVIPGNTGNGIVQIVASVVPAAIATPTTNPFSIESYTQPVPVADIYQNTLLDYILHCAFSKDMNLPGAAQRSQAHFQKFQASLGVKAQAEQTQRADAPGSRFSN
jgi:hypothetical protein